MWDTEVDVLCVGAGIGGLATAIAAADADADVMIVTAGNESSAIDVGVSSVDLHSWLPVAVNDEDTDEYLAALVNGFPETTEPVSQVVATRTPQEPETDLRTVPTFVGTGVADWGSGCMHSLAGALFTTVRGWQVTEMHDAEGRRILVAPIGDMTWRAGQGIHTLKQALTARVTELDIDVVFESPFLRLVFEGGAVVGAVFGGSDQEYAVGARHGVVLAPDVALAVDAPVQPESADRRVCLVSIPGSRFARVELVDLPA